MLSGDGERLLRVPVRASAAALSGSDLVVLVRGRVLRYDAATGLQRQSWPLPDVPVGAPCDRPTDCPPARLRLYDTARGLVVYTLDGEIHLLRLSDGVDRAVAIGSAARFVDGGLVYATTGDAPWIARIRFLPSSALLTEGSR